MTDNEIIKALEYCANHKDCDDGCPCVISESPCVVNNPNTLFDLINRQKAEIERLHSMNQVKLDMLHDIRAELEIAKSEAIREFTEIMKRCARFGRSAGDTEICYSVSCIEQMLAYVEKKMTEENENNA